jgi:hypothetical protein
MVTLPHFSFPKRLGLRLKAEGRAVDHPVFPGRPGMAARRMEDDADVRDVIEMMRLNYDLITARMSGAAGGEDQAL